MALVFGDENQVFFSGIVIMRCSPFLVETMQAVWLGLNDSFCLLFLKNGNNKRKTLFSLEISALFSTSTGTHAQTHACTQYTTTHAHTHTHAHMLFHWGSGPMTPLQFWVVWRPASHISRLIIQNQEPISKALLLWRRKPLQPLNDICVHYWSSVAIVPNNVI